MLWKQGTNVYAGGGIVEGEGLLRGGLLGGGGGIVEGGRDC